MHNPLTAYVQKQPYVYGYIASPLCPSCAPNLLRTQVETAKVFTAFFLSTLTCFLPHAHVAVLAQVKIHKADSAAN